MEVAYGLLIPFAGTTLGAACVFRRLHDHDGTGCGTGVIG